MTIHYGRIQITATGINEVVNNRALVSIPRADIIDIRLTEDFVSETRILFLVVGVAAIGLGVIGLMMLGSKLPKTAITFVAALFAAPLCFRAAFVRGQVLDVKTKKRTRRLGFGEKIEPADLRQLVTLAESEYQYKIHLDLPVAVARRQSS